MTKSDKKNPRQQSVPQRVIIETLKKFRGNVTLTSERLGLSRETIYRRVKREVVQAIREDSDNWRIDVAIGQLDKALIEGERWAVEKILNARAGYGDQQNHVVTIVKIIEGVKEDLL